MGAFAAGPMQVTHKSAANLPQSTQLSLFAVVGTVRARIWSRITTTLGASGGSVTKYLYVPTVGATSQDLSTAVDLSTAAAPAFVFPFTPSFNTQISAGDGACCGSNGSRPMSGVMPNIWVAAGTFKMDCTGNQSGQMEHWCIWHPMTPGSYVYSL